MPVSSVPTESCSSLGSCSRIGSSFFSICRFGFEVNLLGSASASYTHERSNSRLIAITHLHDQTLRAGCFLAAQRQEVLRALDRGGDFSQQLLQVFVALDEVDLRRVHDQQVRR